MSDFDWLDYIKLSEEIYKQHREISSVKDACNRCILSRIYYSVFKTADKYYRLEKNIGSKIYIDKVHKVVMDYFLNSNDPVKRRIAGYLKQLKNDRTNADYTDDFFPNDEQVKYDLMLAQKAYDTINIL